MELAGSSASQASNGNGTGGLSRTASPYVGAYGAKTAVAATAERLADINGSSLDLRRGSSSGSLPPVDATLAAASAASAAIAGAAALAGGPASGGASLRVCGSSQVKRVCPGDGEIVSVHHFNTELGSSIVMGTRRGAVRSWDLRSREVRLEACCMVRHSSQGR